MKILQVALGKIPDVCQKCMDKNKSIASKNNWEYELVTELPEGYNVVKLDMLKTDWYRIDRLTQEKRVLYLDWDATLEMDIDFGPDPVFFKNFDVAIYFGDDLDFAKRVRAAMGEMQKSYYVGGMIVKALRKVFQEDFSLSGAVKFNTWLLKDSKYSNFLAPIHAIRHLHINRRYMRILSTVSKFSKDR